MEAVRPPKRQPFASITGARLEKMDIDELREENKQLRELVIQLSKIVVKNVVERQ